MGDDRRLTDDEAALVFRRATELDRDAGGDGGRSGWDAAALEEAAVEAGISPAAVRRALDEVRAGSLAPLGATPVLPVDAALTGGHGEVVRVTRSVPGTPGAVRANLDVWFAAQLLEPVRDHAGAAALRHRTDKESRRKLERNRDRRFVLRHAEVVVVTVTAEGAARSSVRIEAALRGTTVGRVGDLWAPWGVLAGVGGVAAVAAQAVTVAVLSAVLAVGSLAGTARRVVRARRRRRAEIELAVQGALDRLERA